MPTTRRKPPGSLTLPNNFRLPAPRACACDAGKKPKPKQLAQQAVQQSPAQVAPLATLVTVLAQNGKREEAKKQFAALRTLAAHADMDAPLFAGI